MDLKDIAKARLINQQIAGTKFKTVKEIVRLDVCDAGSGL